MQHSIKYILYKIYYVINIFSLLIAKLQNAHYKTIYVNSYWNNIIVGLLKSEFLLLVIRIFLLFFPDLGILSFDHHYIVSAFTPRSEGYNLETRKITLGFIGGYARSDKAWFSVFQHNAGSRNPTLNWRLSCQVYYRPLISVYAFRVVRFANDPSIVVDGVIT